MPKEEMTEQETEIVSTFYTVYRVNYPLILNTELSDRSLPCGSSSSYSRSAPHFPLQPAPPSQTPLPLFELSQCGFLLQRDEEALEALQSSTQCRVGLELEEVCVESGTRPGQTPSESLQTAASPCPVLELSFVVQEWIWTA